MGARSRLSQFVVLALALALVLVSSFAVVYVCFVEYHIIGMRLATHAWEYASSAPV